MRILIKEKLSEHKSKTPEGYLICQDAILARTGTQEYLKSEIYDDFEGEDTVVSVERKPEQVFSAEALSSFEDKPITVEHPDENVNPDNYSELAVGHTRNIRKSTFNGQEVMIGDLVITDAQTIEDIENGIRTELSCGYDCDITEGDHPEQINIRGNHIALCEQGRAGIAKIIDSKTVSDMAMSRADAMEFCMSLGKVFIEHFDKLYKDPKNDAAKHWCIEMKDKFDKVSSIVLKNNNKPILDGNLRDWFFTAGANPEKYMKNPTDEELSDYDSFVTNLLQSKDFTESIKKILNDSSEIKDVNPRKGESKEDFISRFMIETKEEYPDEKQRVAVAYSYWDKYNKPIKDSEPSEDKYTYKLIKRKNDYDEYVVRCYRNGKYYEDGTYYTDDWEDAVGTMKYIAEREKLNFRENGIGFVADSKLIKSSLEPKDKNKLSKYFSSISTFTKNDVSIEDVLNPIKEMGFKPILEKIDGWNKMDDGMYRKDYFFSLDGFNDIFMVSLYANGNGNWSTTEVNSYFVGKKEFDDSVTQEYEMIRRENESKYGKDFMAYVEKYLSLPENSQMIENKISEDYTEKRPKLLLSDLYYKENEWNNFMAWYQGEKAKAEESSTKDSTEEEMCCDWCGESYPINELKKERDIGYLCPHCIEAIRSRGEKLILEDAKPAWTVMYAWEMEDGDPYTGTAVAYAESEDEAKEIVKSYHPKIESFINVRKGALVNSYDYPYYYHKNIEEDDVEFEDAKDEKEEEKEGETTIKEYIKLELNPEFVEESGDLVTVQFASEEDGERALKESELKDIDHNIISDDSAYYLLFDKQDLMDLVEKFDEERKEDPDDLYVIYAKGTKDDSKALFWTGKGPAKYMDESKAPTFTLDYAKEVENFNGAYTWIKKKVKKAKVDDSKPKYVIYKEDGIFKGTPLDNYSAQIRDARKITLYKDFETLEQVVDYLLKYTDLNREDIMTIGDNSIGDVTVSDNNYPDRFYEKQIKELNKKLKKLEKSDENVKDENEMEYNLQKNSLYQEIKKQIAEYEHKLKKDSADEFTRKIKEWYMKEYPSDEVGETLDADVTFEDLFNCLDAYKDVYGCLGGDADSVVRERCFNKLAEIIDSDYSYIYDQWLKSVGRK